MIIWKMVVNNFKKLIVNWEYFKPIRSNIEDYFNISKNFLVLHNINFAISDNVFGVYL